MSRVRRSLVGRLVELIKQNRGETLLVLGLLTVSGVMHAWNMFAYPYYENDEATYLSRAWHYIGTGELDVYTYRYDQAPAGWMTIALWMLVTAGDTFIGSFLHSGRILMLVVQLVNTLLVYFIARRFSGGSKTAATVAALIFAVSPLSVYFHRRILLDNLMVFWLLIAVLLATRSRRHLTDYIGSGVAFGLAFLTKMTGAVFGLGFLLLIWATAAKDQRKHAIAHWLAFAGATALIFILYAVLKDELLPAPLNENGDPVRVSLIDTFQLQLGRGEFAWPWEPGSQFAQGLMNWVALDWFTLAVGAGATVLMLLLAVVDRKRAAYALAIFVFSLSYVFFLARGGIVLFFYVIPMIPFLAIAVGLVAGWLVSRLPKPAEWRLPRIRPVHILRPVLATGVVLALAAGYDRLVPYPHYTVDETTNQDAALSWVAENVPSDSIVISDNYAYPGLAQSGNFANTEYFFPAQYDPEVKAIYGEDWRNIEYLLLTHEVLSQIGEFMLPDIQAVLDHSELIADFSEGTTAFRDIKRYISTNGDWAQVYRIKSRNDIVLQDAWAHYTKNFIIEYGRVVHPEQKDLTTSVGQVTAMEHALREGDEKTFRGVWQWTKDALQHRPDDSLISWRWDKDPNAWKKGYSTTDCGANQRFIAALASANEKWERSADLLLDASIMVGDFVQGCTFERGGVSYVQSSSDGPQQSRLIKPADFSPSTYRELAEHFPEYDWQKLIDGGYALLDRLVNERGTVPDWVVLAPTGELLSAIEARGKGADSFGPQSASLVEELVLDELNGEARSTPILDAMAPGVVKYAEARKDIAGAVPLLMLSQVRELKKSTDELYLSEIYGQYNPEKGYWVKGDDNSTHAWGMRWHAFQAQLPPEHRINLK